VRLADHPFEVIAHGAVARGRDGDGESVAIERGEARRGPGA
jgi:hypothetical protein